MRFKLDENLPIEAAALLQEAGHDVHTVQDQKLVGASDELLSQACQKENRALVTLDLDFADTRSFPPEQFAGVVVLRLSRQDKTHVLEILRRIIPHIERNLLERRLWIVGERKIRIWPGEQSQS